MEVQFCGKGLYAAVGAHSRHTLHNMGSVQHAYSRGFE
ncbi:hypothetical protein APHCRT_1260 [Anaplasma phagocytophilum str. CRT53-1]|uniref:Uncharacterized protein n=1 Tax=Anaplasma phagocytophilum str. CRT53-1 TaxID=1359157 RepID=A0A0F3PUV3_ANAPH|nr:hypothetical protein APHCRT_1260 [Anaplasma phagocytophilum str. CRT53-1]